MWRNWRSYSGGGILGALKPSGVLYLDEYVGPSRTHWNERTVVEYKELYQTIPLELRHHDDYFPGPIQEDDPSEAIRSGEIESQLRIGFDVVAHRGYGGNILAVLCPNLRMGRVDDALIAKMIEWEEAWLARGDRHFHAVIVAKPKRGLARAVARLRYFAEPKLKRIVRTIVRR